MPKNKKKFKSGRNATAKSQEGEEENSEFAADENASTISNASTNMSYQDLDQDELAGGGKSKPGEEIVEKIDNIDTQLNACLDGLLEKGFKEREDSLKVLKKLFSHKYLVEHLNDKRFTLTESLLKCLKRGKTSEQMLAADAIMLTFIQIGCVGTDAISFLNECKPTLIELMEDEKVEPEVRAACAKAYGLAMFIANDSSVDMLAVLDKLEALFAASYAKGDGSLRVFTPKVYELHSTALSTWCLLLCIMPLSMVNKLVLKQMKHFQDLLKSSDVDLRIVAGETIALLFDLSQCDSHSDLRCFEDESLIETLQNLVNDSSKHKSKKEKKQQRSSFRDILKIIEGDEFESQTIKFGGETLYIDNWARKKQYEFFRDILSTGMNTHLQENEFIREMFDLGAPVFSSDTTRKSLLNNVSRFQKNQFNKEQFRSRTKTMNKKRENKTVSADAGEEED